MNTLKGLEPQANFPQSDLEPGNAEIIALMLQNEELLTSVHTSAEDLMPLFRAVHRPVVGAIRKYDMFDPEQVDAMDLGMGVYEAATVLANPTRMPQDALAVQCGLDKVLKELSRDDAYENSDELVKELVASRRNLAGMVETVAERRSPGREAFVLLGAAVLSRADIAEPMAS